MVKYWRALSAYGRPLVHTGNLCVYLQRNRMLCSLSNWKRSGAARHSQQSGRRTGENVATKNRNSKNRTRSLLLVRCCYSVSPRACTNTTVNGRTYTVVYLRRWTMPPRLHETSLVCACACVCECVALQTIVEPTTETVVVMFWYRAACCPALTNVYGRSRVYACVRLSASMCVWLCLACRCVGVRACLALASMPIRNIFFFFLSNCSISNAKLFSLFPRTLYGYFTFG